MLFEITNIVKGGKYRYCTTIPRHPRANSNGYYPLHIVRCENRFNRLMLPNELVHHKDEDKTNDDPMNLFFKERGPHTRDHNLSRRKASNIPDAPHAEMPPASAPSEVVST